MSPITLKLTTTDPALITLYSDYWRIDKYGKFAVSAEILADRKNLNYWELAHLVARSCIVTDDTRQCSQCQAPYVYASRNDYKENHNKTYPWFCPKCTTQTNNTAKKSPRRAGKETIPSPPPAQCRPHTCH